MPADELTDAPIPVQEPPPLPPAPKRGIAPIWHTVVLIVAIISFSIWGGIRSSRSGGEPMSAFEGTRLLRYALSGVFELVLVAWVAIGLRVRKTPFRSLFGALPRGLNNIVLEAGIAALFWVGSMVVLASFAMTWSVVQTQVYRHQLKTYDQQHAQIQSQKKNQKSPGGSSAPQPSKPEPAKPQSPQQQQKEMARKLMELAPSNGIEIVAWGLLCLVVGFSEECVFRGYIQSQGIQVLRNAVIGVIFSALVFGGAHAYQGVRGMCLIAIYGSLFSGITLLRRNLFPGMLAHSWHDFATGLLLALVRDTHMLDRIPSA